MFRSIIVGLIAFFMIGCAGVEDYKISGGPGSWSIEASCAKNYLELGVSSLGGGFDQAILRADLGSTYRVSEKATGVLVSEGVRASPMLLLQGDSPPGRFKYAVLHKIKLPFSLGCRDYLIEIDFDDSDKLFEIGGDAGSKLYVGKWRRR